MSDELDPSAREYVDRERAAWRDADAIPEGGAARAWAEAPARVRALARARLARIVVAIAALTLLGVGLLGLRGRETAPSTTPQRDTVSDAALQASLPTVVQAPATENKPTENKSTTEPHVTAEVPVVTPPTPPIVNKHERPTTRPRVPTAPAVTSQPEAGVTHAPEPARLDAGVTTTTDAAGEDSLAAEFRLLREARVAIRDGHLERALQICAEHAAKFPAGTLAPERRTLEKRARCLVAERDKLPTPDECR